MTDERYLAKTDSDGDVTGLYKIVGETKLYYKIKFNSTFVAYVDKKTGKERNGDRFCTNYYELVDKEEADKIMLRIKNFNTIISFHYDDWKKVSAETLNKIILLLKEDGLCEVEK